MKQKCFLVIKFLKERTNFFLNVAKETKKWVIKVIIFLKKIRKELSKINLLLLFGLKKIEIYELSETQKEKKFNNSILFQLIFTFIYNTFSKKKFSFSKISESQINP